MKTATVRRNNYTTNPQIPFPNAATRKELIHRFLDLLLMGATGAGLAASLLFLLVIL